MKMDFKVSDAYLKKYSILMEEAPFERDIQEVFLRWKYNPTRTILRLDGARQIGKTTELLKFGYRYYEHVLYVNLSEADTNSDFEKAFRASRDYSEVLLSFFDNYIDTRDTLLIIDEIQLSSNIYNRIKEFKRQLSCDVVVTGSYLGRITSQNLYNAEDDIKYFVPVGTIYAHTMYPMSYGEFAKALGYSDEFENTIHLIKDSKDKEIIISQHELLSNLFSLYKILGGYPSVVKLYVDTKDLESCHTHLLQILDRFKEESMTYYTSDNKELIFSEIFSIIFDLMLKGGTVKNFSIDLLTAALKEKYKDLAVSRQEVNKALTWIITSGVIGVCHRYNEGRDHSITHNARLYFKDLGLLYALANESRINSEHFKGLVAETFSYNELSYICDSDYSNPKIVRETTPYYSTSNSYELDFMFHGSNFLNNDNVIYGIEVKSGDSSHKSLNFFKSHNYITKSVLANDTNTISQIGTHNTRLELPLYLIRYAFYCFDDITKKATTLTGESISKLENLNSNKKMDLFNHN